VSVTSVRAANAPRPLVLLGLGLLLAVSLFWRLGQASFWDPDEAHYAQTTRELIETGDWLAPFYNGQPFFDKPILFYWFQAVAMSTAADPEAGARLAPALAGVLLVAVTAWLGTQLAGAAVGWIAALLLAANPGMFGLARYAILDLPFTLFLFGGVSAVAVAMLRERPRLEWAGYVLIGLATALKGPVAIILCGVTFVLCAVASTDLRNRLLALRWVRGLSIAIAFGLPWPLYMLWRFDQAFVDGYILNENLRLYATPMYEGQPGWWFYLGILAVGMLPWTPLLLARAVDHWSRRRAASAAPDLFDRLLWCWVVAIVGFFSFSSFKLDHYVFPTAPALSIIAARAWVQWREAPATVHGSVAWAMRLVGPTLALAGAGVAYAALVFLDLPRTFLVVPLALVAAGVAATIRYRTGGASAPQMPVAALIAMGVLYAGVVLWVFPKLEEGKVVPDVARWVATHAGPDDRIAAFRLNRWSTAFRFYVQRPVTRIESDEDARQFFVDSRPFYCVMTGELYDALRAAGVPLRVAYEREGRWVTSGRALWRSSTGLTRFVVAAPAPSPPAP
jgi:4-amino-4-deoxy-L-arabinose transferase-like glycosyltransferase